MANNATAIVIKSMILFAPVLFMFFGHYWYFQYTPRPFLLVMMCVGWLSALKPVQGEPEIRPTSNPPPALRFAGAGKDLHTWGVQRPRHSAGSSFVPTGVVTRFENFPGLRRTAQANHKPTERRLPRWGGYRDSNPR